MEQLTTDYEKRIFEILDEVEERGGTIKLIEEGWFQKHISDFAYETALRKQSGEKTVIGVNRYVESDEKHDIETHPYDQTTAERQVSRTRRVRPRGATTTRWRRCSTSWSKSPGTTARTSCRSPSRWCARARPWGDIVEKLKELWGTYRETPVF